MKRSHSQISPEEELIQTKRELSQERDLLNAQIRLNQIQSLQVQKNREIISSQVSLLQRCGQGFISKANQLHLDYLNNSIVNRVVNAGAQDALFRNQIL